MTERALENDCISVIHQYQLEITTELDEHETLKVSAVSGSDAEDLAMELVTKGMIGLKGRKCVKIDTHV